MAFEYKFGKKKSDAPEPTLSRGKLKEIRKQVREQDWFPEFSLEKQVEELTKQLEEKDEMILHDCERISGLEQQIEMLQCLIETKDKVIANLNKQVELQNNLNDLIEKMQKKIERSERIKKRRIERMLRLLVDDKVECNAFLEEDKHKYHMTRLKSDSNLSTGSFEIEFLGVDKKGNEIYRGDKDSWQNFVNYLHKLYRDYFSVVVDENNKDRLTFSNKQNLKNEEGNKMNEVGTVTVNAKEYDSMKAKAESFDKLIDIVCHDGVKFYQEWNKNEIRKNVKGGSVKVGEVIGKWHGEIKFTGDEGQKDFSEFVNAMIDGLDREQKGKILVE